MGYQDVMKSPSILYFYKSIFSIYKKHPRLFAALLASIFISMTLINFLKPWFFKIIFDDALPTKNLHVLITFMLALACLYLICIFCNSLEMHISPMLTTKIISRLRIVFMNRIQNLNLKKQAPDFDGNALARFSGDIVFLENILTYIAWRVAGYILFGTASIFLLFYISWKMAIISLLFFPVIFLISMSLSKKNHDYSVNKTKNETNLLLQVKKEIYLQDVIRYLRLKNHMRRIFKTSLKATNKFSFPYNRNIGFASIIPLLGMGYMELLMIGVGSYLIITGSMTLGSLVAFIIVLENVTASINTLSANYPNLVRASECMLRIHEINSFRTTSFKNRGHLPVPPIKEICYKSVGVKLDNVDILSDINFTIHSNQFIALVGHSGAGKSTLLRVLLNDQEISSGKIFLNDVDFTSYSLNSFYSHMQYIPQEAKLFPTTIKENIRYGKLNASDKEIYIAAKLAEIHETIVHLPEGYNTDLSENTLLSGGQKQRIAIARALIAKPNILLLDEVTSALDPITAASIDATLNNMRGKQIIFLVSHRLQSVVNADQIYVIKNGRITEHGSHEDLLKKNGEYTKLWTLQNSIALSEDMHLATISTSLLENIPLLKELDKTSLEEVKKYFFIERFEANKVVFDEGDIGYKFYIIVSGVVTVSKFDEATKTQKYITQLHDGDYFGEIALLYDLPRSASIITNGVCIFLTLHRVHAELIFNNLSTKAKDALFQAAQQHLKN